MQEPSQGLLNVIDGRYRTPPQRIGWLSKTFPTIAFFSRLTGIVLRSAWKAKRGRYDGRAWANSSIEVLRALESVGVQFDVRGIEHLESIDGACLVVGNHMSTLETMILPGIIQPLRETSFVVKQQLITYPIFKHIMRSRNPIAVTQTDPRGDFKLMMSGGQERLADGVSLIVFPQGQRTESWESQRFNSIGTKLANKSKVPIVPLALKTDAWGLGPIISDFGRIDPQKKVYFEFASPITVEGRGVEENQEIIDFITSRLSDWGSTKTSQADQQS
ncbi:MAG: lysophospholipid acyltransferase family protein [Planctomycetota bacterium]